MSKAIIWTLLAGVLIYLALAAFVFFRQRSLLYFPTHDSRPSALRAWEEKGERLGYCREAEAPSTIWLMAHGNGGQASDREYVLNALQPDASLYVVEYPGYGFRPGEPSAESMNQAVAHAYARLIEKFPGKSIGLIGESIGSGPICAAVKNASVPPRKVVLLVPFDTLVSVAAERMRLLPVNLLLRDRWDNVSALRGVAGPVEIYGARFDEVIPVEHAKHLADTAGAKFILLQCGHNDWSTSGVRIE